MSWPQWRGFWGCVMAERPPLRIEVIPRGRDLSDADLRLLVEDFIVVRNWAALQMRMGVPQMKRELLRALRARLGRDLDGGGDDA